MKELFWQIVLTVRKMRNIIIHQGLEPSIVYVFYYLLLAVIISRYKLEKGSPGPGTKPGDGLNGVVKDGAETAPGVARGALKVVGVCIYGEGVMGVPEGTEEGDATAYPAR